MSIKYLHTMLRVSDPEASVAFFGLLGLEEVRRHDSEQGRFTLIFLAGPGQKDVAEVELTYNWPPEDGSSPEQYGSGRNFGHLAYAVDDIYALCQNLMDAGVTINRPPRDGHMAFAVAGQYFHRIAAKGRKPAGSGTLGEHGKYRRVVSA